jgi:hypothetical protein
MPIPIGMHWSSEALQAAGSDLRVRAGGHQQEDEKRPANRSTDGSAAKRNAQPVDRNASPSGLALGGLRSFATRKPTPEKRPRAKRAKIKIDPSVATAARELRDRWLEEINQDEQLLESRAKYDVSRALLEQAASGEMRAISDQSAKLLPAA